MRHRPRFFKIHCARAQKTPDSAEILRQFRPIVMVASSVDANLIIQKNRLTIAQLLQPYGLESYKLPGMQCTSHAQKRFNRIYFKNSDSHPTRGSALRAEKLWCELCLDGRGL